MKKSIIALSTVLVLVVSGSAAAGINFNGSLETNLDWHKGVEEDAVVQVSPSSELELNFGLKTGEEKTRAVVEFGIKDENKTGLDLELDASKLALKKAYIETDGAFWYGGPEATTRFGSLDINYGPFAKVDGEYGVSVSNMQVGPASLNGFYSIPTEENEIKGMRADVSVQDAQAGSTIIHDNNGFHFVIDGVARPMENLVVGAGFTTQKDFAEEVDGEEANGLAGLERLFVVGAEYQVDESTSVHGGYRSITNKWKPAYIANKNNRNDQGQNWVHEGDRQDKGIYIGVATEQQGVYIHADYDQMFEEAILAARTEVEGYDLNVQTVIDVNKGEEQIRTNKTSFGAAKTFTAAEGLEVDTSYKGTWVPGNGVSHTVGAQTTLGMVPAINGLELSTAVTVADRETIGYTAGAEFNAPNGVSLAVERVGGNYADEDVVLGTTAKAGISVKF